jgi:O-antigen/teichoic acid export membrane protein
LILGFLVSIISILPYSVLIAAGRTDFFAKMYWIELPIYSVVCWVLIANWGISGAAAAYASRTILEALWISFVCRRYIGLRPGIHMYLRPLAIGLLILTPVLFITFINNWSFMLPVSIVACFLVYLLWAWKALLESPEKTWLRTRVSGMLGPT